ncbi:uncharacterized protein LOC125834383 [Solanum verrucosum]|uniref:uncharacterized protein LOC125834383 n=1 Tax=Solanum verrucosum TaxID=315347 RepID=UPI0020D0BDEB|nr:uncharacterized protein LOC125834383 [Solanum verrucosum]
MNVGCFLQLADEMKTRGLLTDSRMVRVEEQLAIFLFTLAHNERNRVVQNRFQHSGETISRYFNKCLKACLRLGKHYVKQAGKDISQEISSNPFFLSLVQDGTHIPALIPIEEQPRYRNQKGVLSQNVLAVVDFDMNFQYVLSGWEGSASDSRVLRNVVWERSENRLKISNGYANTKGFLAPYRGARYHLREWSQTQAPQNARELYNLRHSKLQNVVERTFAVLKKRFPILTTPPPYSIKNKDSYFEEHMEEEIEDSHGLNDIDSDSDEEDLGRGPTDADKQFMCNIRDEIAQQMWNTRAIR